MNRPSPWLLLLLALAACSKNSARPSAKMSGPQGVAVYRGYAPDQPDVLRPLVAVANTLGDDLRLIDAVTDKVLAGPTLVAALAVPTEARPSLIAAGSLHDLAADGTALAKPDLLVVAPRGQVWSPLNGSTGGFGAVIQSIVTWDASTRVDAAATRSLGELLPDATLTSLVVAPVWSRDAGVLAIASGKALVVAGTSDGALVTILATRSGPGDAIQLAVPVVQPLGFTVLDLAVSPDGTRIFAGTLDPIPGTGGVLGVAEFDNTVNVVAADNVRPVVAMPVRGLSAGLGTTQVAALDVAPFIASDPATPDLDSFGPAAPRVYAVLDPAACGWDRVMPCGIAAIDPVLGSLAADPAGELPYQLPIQVPGEVVDFAVSGPPLHSDHQGYLKFDPGSGVRWTQAIAGVATTAGRIYLVDLSHFSVGNSMAPLSGTNITRVIISGSSQTSAASAALGIWSRPVTGAPAVQFDALAGAGIVVTPGYTRGESFSITYQGALPGLNGRGAVAHVVSGAPSWIAVQSATGLTGPGTSPWRGVARLYDPRLAIRVGDLVVLRSFPAGVCTGGAFELEVTAILPPDPLRFPGGAVAVTPRATQPPGADPSCLPSNSDTEVTADFLVPRLVLSGSISGYAGRPEIVPASPETAAPFEFRYQDERALSCPIMPDDPQSWPPTPGDIAACEADVVTCRSTCEKLVLARRARRSFYVTDGCPAATTTAGQACLERWVTGFGLQFPLPRGPTLAFKVGITDPAKGLVLARGVSLSFTTSSGQQPTSRVPVAGATGLGATAPYGVTMFDRSAATGSANDGLHGYAAFADNLVLDFAPWSSTSAAATIR